MSPTLIAMADQVTSTRAATGVAVSVVLFIYLAIVVISILAAVKVVTKAGYSGWWVLITLVPVLNFVMLLVFAFSEWPVVREVKTLRAQLSSWPGYGAPPGYDSAAGYGGASYPAGSPFPSDRGSEWAARGPLSGGPTTESDEEPPLPPFDTVVPPATPDHGRAATADQADSASGAPVDQAPQQGGGQAPPGWYPTPDGRVRYWDGTAWTDHFAP
jgi:Protein of unknown function (DUF2510)